MEDELHKMGVTVNEEEELNQIKNINVEDPELNKELEKLLSHSVDDDELEGPIDSENADEQDISEMLSFLAINEEITPISSPNDKEKTKPVLMQDVIKGQIDNCVQAIDFYTKKGFLEKKSLFEKRKDALTQELNSCKLGGSSFVKAKVNYEVGAPVNDSISDDELVVSCRDLNTEGKLRICVTFEFYSNCQSKYITSGFAPVSLKIKRNDVRTIKFFEHRRIRLQLIEPYSYWLILTGYRPVDTSTIKLDPLLRENTYEVQVKLGGKSYKIKLELRRPILANMSSNYLKKSEVWQIPNTGTSAGLYSELPLRKQAPLIILPIEEIKSYNGLEYEINLIPKDTSDVALKDRLFLLEAQRDMLNLQVQTGRLLPDQYAKLLERERGLIKNRAVEWRDKGDKDRAKRYLMHMKLIEQELQELSSDCK